MTLSIFRAWRRLLALAVVAGALPGCAGDEVDEGTPLCTRALYQSCGSEHDCASMECQPFADMQVCTQSCSDANPCPAQGGASVPCDPSGYCKPPVEDTCRLLPPGGPTPP